MAGNMALLQTFKRISGYVGGWVYAASGQRVGVQKTVP